MKKQKRFEWLNDKLFILLLAIWIAGGLADNLFTPIFATLLYYVYYEFWKNPKERADKK